MRGWPSEPPAEIGETVTCELGVGANRTQVDVTRVNEVAWRADSQDGAVKAEITATTVAGQYEIVCHLGAMITTGRGEWDELERNFA